MSGGLGVEIGGESENQRRDQSEKTFTPDSAVVAGKHVVFPPDRVELFPETFAQSFRSIISSVIDSLD